MIPAPKFEGCDRCTELHQQLEAEVERPRVDGEDVITSEKLKMVTDLIQHLQEDHKEDLALKQMEHEEYHKKAKDHENNPLVKAWIESGEEGEPLFEGDVVKRGFDSVCPSRPQPWMEGFFDFLLNEVYPASLQTAGYQMQGVILLGLVQAAFLGGVYAERNRLVNEAIAL